MSYFMVDGVEIPFSKDWKNIAISLSGGADSALLAFLLCHYNEPITVHCISHIRMWKTRPWQKIDSENIFNWLSARFPNNKFVRHVNFIAPELEYGNIGPTLTDEYGKMVSGDNIEIRAYAEFICYTENCDAYYNAVTRNPRNVSFQGMIERDIEPNNDNQHLRLIKHMGKYAVHPFRFIEKSWVLKQYKNHAIQDLLEITRSCEGEFKEITYENYKPYQHVPTCNKCFWCLERNWAIEQSK